MEYKTNFSNKEILFYLIISLIISSSTIILTTPLHEGAHWVISEIDPYVEPIEFHVFDTESLTKGDHILTSALGYVKIKEKYPNAFKDRPIWADLLQEIICISIQMIIAIIITYKTTILLIKRNTKQVV